ncbi:MAG: sugar ABC transporter substrate-binding protein [Caldilineaceae bacterium SB0670_bin_27]|uniref:Sugar ABC transporter substrate-binding protein n=1 Tax=Caldilineaceae bacterium SB0664_bin_27 TaxID=2605260 RepID=A0A6B0YMF0_9CHLR|nr:sugar ABC transporter substrate-binding protein [Caldilineaceae bacterium]MDE0336218.1 sugar ABC transporter substrate-binding protein [Caldilineaceae bacterium]MXY92224.1 sugar ABC transporter substrate-binding protein [Caldilineaceae bacterium SB0664_bin_27]MYJ77874.1 sugar ABC transporter substrate-binding protein [Caldilineaceae bacterium SB0670_bin_27]
MSRQPTLSHQNMSRRDMLRLTGVGAAGVALAACAAPAAAPASGGDSAPAMEPVTIIATTGMPVNTFDNALERSLERLPNIAMEVNANSWGEGGWDGYSDTMLTRIAGGEQIDVIMIAIEGLRLLTAKNVLVELDDFFAADEPANDILHNDIHVTLREMLQVDSKQYLFPFSWNNMVMYYNTAIFEEEGLDPPPTDWTWDDFLQTCHQVANVTGGADDRFAYSFWGASMFGMCAWYFNNDASPISDDWLDSNLLDPKVAETLQFLADLILEHKVAPNPEGWDEWAQFHAGNLVMRTCGRWCIAGSLEAEFDTYDIQYQPHNAGPLKTVAGTEGWGVSTSSENPEEAWEVVKHLAHSDTSIDLVKVGGSIPALRSVSEMPVFAEYGPANTALFYESLDVAATVPSPTNFNIVEPILNRNYATIWNGERSVEEAMQAAHAELQPEMDKLKQA